MSLTPPVVLSNAPPTRQLEATWELAAAAEADDDMCDAGAGASGSAPAAGGPSGSRGKGKGKGKGVGKAGGGDSSEEEWETDEEGGMEVEGAGAADPSTAADASSSAPATVAGSGPRRFPQLPLQPQEADPGPLDPTYLQLFLLKYVCPAPGCYGTLAPGAPGCGSGTHVCAVCGQGRSEADFLAELGGAGDE